MQQRPTPQPGSCRRRPQIYRKPTSLGAAFVRLMSVGSAGILLLCLVPQFGYTQHAVQPAPAAARTATVNG